MCAFQQIVSRRRDDQRSLKLTRDCCKAAKQFFVYEFCDEAIIVIGKAFQSLLNSATIEKHWRLHRVAPNIFFEHFMTATPNKLVAQTKSVLLQAQGRAAHWRTQLLDMLFPPCCLACDMPIIDADGLCPNCWGQVAVYLKTLLPGFRCSIRCGHWRISF